MRQFDLRLAINMKHQRFKMPSLTLIGFVLYPGGITGL